jgi:membrane-bound lytic murein transglycosylase A
MTSWLRAVLAPGAAILLGLLIGVAAGPHILAIYAKVTAPAPDRLVFTPVPYSALPGWDGDPLTDFLPAFNRSCGRFLAKDSETPVGPADSGGHFGKAGDWAPVCRKAEMLAAQNPDAQRIRNFLEQELTPLALGNHKQRAGRFTGYYEPELRGSLRRHGAYREALLKPPKGLVSVNLGDFNPQWRGQRIAGRLTGGSLKPLQSRAEIMAGALDGENLHLLYVDDPVDAFFLHIQGSGRVRLDDGRVIRLGYAGQNGHPYVAIGKVLLEQGALSRENISMQSIRDWLAANPAERDGILAQNPSYIFFRILDGGDPAMGPPGAAGVSLTPGRSLAVDLDFYPLGVPLWLDAEAPADTTGARIQRLMVAQDTGGAIRGPVRGDVFWGAGAAAAENAGRMNSEGRLYLLLPRPVAEQAMRESE